MCALSLFVAFYATKKTLLADKCLENFNLLNSQLKLYLCAPLIINKSNYKHFVVHISFFCLPLLFFRLSVKISFWCCYIAALSWLFFRRYKMNGVFHCRYVCHSWWWTDIHLQYLLFVSIHSGWHGILIFFSLSSCLKSWFFVPLFNQWIGGLCHTLFEYKSTKMNILLNWIQEACIPFAVYSQHTNQCTSAPCRHTHKISQDIYVFFLSRLGHTSGERDSESGRERWISLCDFYCISHSDFSLRFTDFLIFPFWHFVLLFFFFYLFPLPYIGWPNGSFSTICDICGITKRNINTNVIMLNWWKRKYKTQRKTLANQFRGFFLNLLFWFDK